MPSIDHLRLPTPPGVSAGLDPGALGVLRLWAARAKAPASNNVADSWGLFTHSCFRLDTRLRFSPIFG
jgi:hypothetical protein